MFDVSFGELALVVIVAIVAIGPKELPTALRATGKWLSQWRGLMNELREGWEELTEEIPLEDAPPKRIRGDDGTYYEAYDVTDLEDMAPKRIAAPQEKKEKAGHD